MGRWTISEVLCLLGLSFPVLSRSLPFIPLTMSADQRLSEVVRALRFPLIVLVVFAHVALRSSFFIELPWAIPSDHYTWYLYISRIGSYVLAYLTVPMFFLFSGYYMFTKPKNWWSRDVYSQEMKKRWTTLVVPYLIWCTLPLLTDQLLLLSKGGSLPWNSLSSSLSRLAYTYVSGPENYPLWYVRDLILMTLLAPIVDWTSRRAPWLILVFFVVYVLGYFPPLLPSPKAIIYFSLGAILGARRVNILTMVERFGGWLVSLFLLATLGLPFLPEGAWHGPLHQLYVPLSMAGSFCLGGWVYDRMPKLHRFYLGMEKYVFFIYVAHEVLVLSVVRGFLYRHGWLETVWGYFLCGGLVLGICLVAYIILARWARRPLAISLGGRL
mgnify:FL=1